MANIPTANNNPGDLKDPKTGMFRKFASPEEGFGALQSDLTGKITGATTTGLNGNSTLLDFSNVWAPSSDKNDPTGYATKLSKKLGVPVTTPIGSLKDRVSEFASAIADNEGYQGNRVLGETEKAQPAQQESPSQGESQLSHSQMIANINAMEQQGAQPQEIQGYLDSLKGGSSNGPSGQGYVTKAEVPQTAASTSSPESSEGKGLMSDIGKGDYAGAASDAIQGLGNLLTGGGTGQLGNAIGTNSAILYNKVKGLLGGRDDSQYITPADPGQAIEGGLKTALGAASVAGAGTSLQNLITDSGPLSSDIAQQAIKDYGISDSKSALSLEDKIKALTDAVSDPDNVAKKSILSQALSQAQKAYDVENGVGTFSEVHPGISKAGGLLAKILKTALSVGGAGIAGAGAESLWNSIKNKL